jgi:predicted cobalt transporter CbtA
MLTSEEVWSVLEAAGITEFAWRSADDFEQYLLTVAAEVSALPDDDFAVEVFELRLGDLRWIGDRYGLSGLQRVAMQLARHRCGLPV